MHPCAHAYHALTRVLGPCAIACADAHADGVVLGPMSWRACFINTCARHGVGASEPKKITSPGLRLRVSFYESQEQHRVQGGVVAGLERDMLQPWRAGQAASVGNTEAGRS